MNNFKRIWMISDTHWGARANSSMWQDTIENYHRKVFIPLLKKEVKKGDVLVHAGDMFDNRQTLNLLVGNAALSVYTEIAKILPIYIIVGNHDIYRKKTNDISSLDFLKNVENIHVLKDAKVFEWSEEKVLLMPWQSHRESEINTITEHSSASIVICHSEVAGVQLNHGIKSFDGVPIANYKKFKQVFSGHIHHRALYDNVQMLGCPYQITRSDTKNSKGVTLYDIKKDEIVFFENNYSPKFLKIPLDKILDFKLEELKKVVCNNYIDLYIPSKIASKYNMSLLLQELQNISKTIDPIIYDENENINLSIYHMSDFSGSAMDIVDLAKKHIASTTYDDKLKKRILDTVLELYSDCQKI